MTRFQLGAGADLLDFGFDGSVLDHLGQPAGNWRTGSDNSIQVKTADGHAKSFAVAWAFNADNQLVLSAGGQELANFQNDTAVRPGFELRKCVLRVTPNRLAGFAFELRGDWTMTPAHDLEFSLGASKSRLLGLISDAERRNRFLFIFKDSKHPLLQHALQFEGHWEAPATGEANLRFVYTDKDGADRVFELPGNVVINKSTNQLRYEYTKNGKKSIDFDGTLLVTPDLRLVYKIGRTQTQTGDTVVSASVISIGATLTKDSFSGDLAFEARRIDGQKTSLVVAGSFVGVLSPNAKLAAGFSFQQVQASGQVTTTVVGFEGELQFKNSSTVNWVFSSSNAATRTISLAVGADIQLSDKVSLDGRLNLQTSNGKVQSVSLLLGVRF